LLLSPRKISRSHDSCICGAELKTLKVKGLLEQDTTKRPNTGYSDICKTGYEVALLSWIQNGHINGETLTLVDSNGIGISNWKLRTRACNCRFNLVTLDAEDWD
jgi:hypothetical protein